MNLTRLTAAALILVSGCVAAKNYEVRTTARLTFEPANLTIQPGDSVTWINAAGGGGVGGYPGGRAMPHNVVADDGSFRCARGCEDRGGDGDPSAENWRFTLTFNDPGEIPYYCFVHGGPGGEGMSGVITVEADQPEPPPSDFEINFGITGGWIDPVKNKPGSENDARAGFSLEVVPLEGNSDLLVAYWFTYHKSGAQPGAEVVPWLQGLGDIEGNQAVLTTVRCQGGAFDSENAASCPEVGTITATFSSCTQGQIAYSLDLQGGPAEESTGQFSITRLTPDFLCQELAAEPAQQ